MKTADIADLTERVRQLLAASKLSEFVRDVYVEPAFTYGDDEVLRVHIRVAHPDKMASKDASEIINQIVDDLWAIDERFPSVRFDEAA